MLTGRGGGRAAGTQGLRTLGVEEELLVVDAGGRVVPRGPEVLRRASLRGDGESVEEHERGEGGGDRRLVPELTQQQVELGTPVCTTSEQVERELRGWRARAGDAAAQVGARVVALATSPLDVEPAVTPGERYERMVEVFGGVAAQQLTCGCHVHVSVSDDEEAVAVLDRVRPWLAVLTAFSANSPFWHGSDTGYASYRSQVWGRWPSAGPSDVFGSAAAYHRALERMLATGTLLDEGMVYADVRLSRQWPTVEVRVADVMLHVEDVVVHAALVRALVETAARSWRSGEPPPEVPTAVLRLAAFRAARSGLGADLVHPETGRPAPAAVVLRALVAHVRGPLDDAGDLDRVEAGVAEVLARGTGAEVQRRLHHRTGDLAAVVRSAADLTAGTTP